MKKIFFFVACFISTFLVAQDKNAPNTKRMDELIVALSATPFIKDYTTYRSDIEAKVLELKAETSLDPKEVGKTKIIYRQCQDKFDAVFDELKRDLSTSAGRKLLKKSPHQFAERYQTQLDEAKAFCNNNFVAKADRLLKKDAIDPIILGLVVNTFISIVKNYMDKQAADDAFNLVYLDAKLIQPLKFKSWDKITFD